MIIENATVPLWAMTAQNQEARCLKYQHLLDGLRRRIQSASDCGNQTLELMLRQELDELEREI
jgi:hypothetical protein